MNKLTTVVSDRFNTMKDNLRSDSTLRLILVVVAVFGIVYFGRQCGKPHDDTPYEKAIATWQQVAKVEIAKNKTLLAHNDSLNKIIVKDSAKADSLTKHMTKKTNNIVAQRDKLGQQLDSLEKNTKPDECMGCLNLAKAFKAQLDSSLAVIAEAEKRDSLRVKDITNLRSMNSSLLIQNDSLVHLIKTVPIAKKEKFLGFIPLPSRTTSLVIGIIGGAGLTVGTIAAIK